MHRWLLLLVFLFSTQAVWASQATEDAGNELSIETTYDLNDYFNDEEVEPLQQMLKGLGVQHWDVEVITELSVILGGIEDEEKRARLFQAFITHYPPTAPLYKKNPDDALLNPGVFLEALSLVDTENIPEVMTIFQNLSRSLQQYVTTVEQHSMGQNRVNRIKHLNSLSNSPAILFPLINTTINQEDEMDLPLLANVAESLFKEPKGTHYQASYYTEMFQHLAPHFKIQELHQVLLDLVKRSPDEYGNLLRQVYKLHQRTQLPIETLRKSVSKLLELDTKVQKVFPHGEVKTGEAILHGGLQMPERLDVLIGNLAIAKKTYDIFFPEGYLRFGDERWSNDLEGEVFYDLLGRTEEEHEHIRAWASMAHTLIPPATNVDEFLENYKGGDRLTYSYYYIKSWPMGDHSRTILEKSQRILAPYHDIDHKFSVLQTLFILPPNLLDEAIDVLGKPENIQEILEVDDVVDLMAEDIKNIPILKKCLKILLDQTNWDLSDLKQYWLRAFLSPHLDVVKPIVKYVRDMRIPLQLTESDELYQEMILAMTRLSNTTDLDNPFTVYKGLLVKRKEKVGDTLTIPQKTAFGYYLQMNPSYLEDRLPHQVIRFGQLPKMDYKGYLHERVASFRLFHHWEQNFDVHPFNREVLRLTNQSWQTFNSAVLGSSYLFDLVHFTGVEPTDIIPHHRAQFCRILESAYSQSKEVPSGEILSESDRTLLQFLSWINSCRSGKREGIKVVFACLSSEFKVFQGIQTEDDVNPAAELVHGVLIEEMEKLVSGGGSDFYKKLCDVAPDENVEQSPHQAAYVRNLIPALGPVYFDTNTGCIYSNLLGRSKQEVMETFYTYWRPEPLLQAITARLNEGLAEKDSSLYTPINAYFQDDEGRQITQSRTGKPLWDFDTSSGDIQIAPEGAIEFLHKMGVFRVTAIGPEDEEVLE